MYVLFVFIFFSSSFSVTAIKWSPSSFRVEEDRHHCRARVGGGGGGAVGGRVPRSQYGDHGLVGHEIVDGLGGHPRAVADVQHAQLVVADVSAGADHALGVGP